MAFCVRLGAFVSGWASLGVSPPGFLRACRRPRLEALSGVPLFREVHTVNDLCTSAANFVFPGLRLLLLPAHHTRKTVGELASLGLYSGPNHHCLVQPSCGKRKKL